MSGGDTKLLGRWGEALVAEDLRKKGSRIVAAGWSCRFGEIDLVAESGGFLVFVEVKLRKNANFASPMEFVDAKKQQRLRITAELYLAQFPTELQPRFDVVEVLAPQGMATIAPQIHYVENAF